MASNSKFQYTNITNKKINALKQMEQNIKRTAASAIQEVEKVGRAQQSVIRQMEREQTRASATRAQLGIRAEKDIQQELVRTRQAYQLLARSGQASQAVLQRATRTSITCIKELNAELGKSSKLQKSIGFGGKINSGVNTTYQGLTPAKGNEEKFQANTNLVAVQAFGENKTADWIAKQGSKQIKDLVYQLVSQQGGTADAALGTINEMLSKGLNFDQVKQKAATSYKSVLAAASEIGEYNPQNAFQSNQQDILGKKLPPGTAQRLENLANSDNEGNGWQNSAMDQMEQGNNPADVLSKIADKMLSGDKEYQKYKTKAGEGNDKAKQQMNMMKGFVLSQLLRNIQDNSGPNSAVDMQQMQHHIDVLTGVDSQSLQRKKLEVMQGNPEFQRQKNENLAMLQREDDPDPSANRKKSLRTWTGEHPITTEVTTAIAEKAINDSVTSAFRLTPESVRETSTGQKIGRLGKSLGRKTGVLLGIGMGVYNDYDITHDDTLTPEQKHDARVKNVGSTIGGTIGGWLGGMLGGAIGTAVLPVGGTAVGGVAGGIYGGVKGGEYGETVAGWWLDFEKKINLSKLSENISSVYKNITSAIFPKDQETKLIHIDLSKRPFYSPLNPATAAFYNPSYYDEEMGYGQKMNNTAAYFHSPYHKYSNSYLGNRSFYNNDIKDLYGLKDSYGSDAYWPGIMHNKMPQGATQVPPLLQVRQPLDYQATIEAGNNAVGSQLEKINNTLANQNQVINNNIQLQVDGRIIASEVSRQQLFMYNRGGGL